MSKSKKKRRESAGQTEAAKLRQELPAAEDPRGRGAELAKRAMIEARPDLARELEQLTPEEAAMFLELIDKALKKRRIQLAGYLLSLVGMIGGMLFALYTYGSREPGEFVGWAFLVPFVLVAASLLIFGRWSRRI